MRSKVAKRLRNQARKVSEPTRYKIKWFERIIGKTKEGDEIKHKTGTIESIGYRKNYKNLKKQYKNK